MTSTGLDLLYPLRKRLKKHLQLYGEQIFNRLLQVSITA